MAPRAYGVAYGCVEDIHAWRRSHALPVRVHAATVKRAAMILYVNQCVARRIADLLPDVSRLIGLDARAANPMRQQPSGLKCNVAEHLRIHTEARTMREQQIARDL